MVASVERVIFLALLTEVKMVLPEAVVRVVSSPFLKASRSS
jgi:hypothetical protein